MRTAKWKHGFWTAVTAVFAMAGVLRAGAVGNADESLPDPTDAGESENILSVDLPVISENEPSPFDFYIDPQGLLYLTNAGKYGGGSVEEGATVLFRNHGGKYDFSSHSDMLTVGNRSEVPVRVILTAGIEQIEGVHLVTENSFEGQSNDLYLAVVDDMGNEQAVTAEQAVTLEWELDAGKSYSFGLTGSCTRDWAWTETVSHVVIKLTWRVEETAEINPELSPADETQPEITDAEDKKTAGEEDSKSEEQTTEPAETGDKNGAEEKADTIETKGQDGFVDETQPTQGDDLNSGENGIGDSGTSGSTNAGGNNSDENTGTVSGGDL